MTIIDETSTNKFSQVVYSIKMVNQKRMSDFKISGTKHCESLDELKMFLSDNIPGPEEDKPDFSKVDLGYFEPGHGTKGKKVWLCTDGDLKLMYSKYSPSNKVILMWCYTQVKPTSARTAPKAKDESSIEESKKSGVDEYYHTLTQKHKGSYTPEQLRAWAHLLQMQVHD